MLRFLRKKRSKFDVQSVCCQFFGYSEHQKVYRFEEVESDHLLVSCDAKFMTDMYDGGRRDLLYNEVVVQDDDEATDQDCSQHNQADPENKESAQEKEVKSDSKRH